MAYCMKCGTENPNQAKFCFNCGAEMSAAAKEEAPVRKSVSDGTIHKCPSCGGVLDYISSKCPFCGYELRGVKASGAVHDLARNLQEIDSSMSLRKDALKVSAIQNFAIPNTKEDIIEFMIMASSSAGQKDKNPATSNISAAWMNKMEQAYNKATFQFRDEPEYEEIRRLYQQGSSASASVRSEAESYNKKNTIIGMCFLLGIPVGIIIMVIILS